MSAMLYIHTAEPLKMLLKSDRESVKVSQTGHTASSTTADLHSVYLEVVKTAKIIGLLGSFVLTRKTSSVSHREDIADILNIQEICLLRIKYNTHSGANTYAVHQNVCLFHYCQARSRSVEPLRRWSTYLPDSCGPPGHSVGQKATKLKFLGNPHTQ